MKSVIVKPQVTVRQPSFPCLMYAKDGLVVLFSKPECGMVVIPNRYWEVGAISTSWGMEHFKPFNGVIQLSNDETFAGHLDV